MSVHPLLLTHTATIPRAAPDVYALVADASKRPNWMVEMRSTDAPARALQQGDQFDGQTSILLHDFLGRSEVTRAVPGEVIEERVVIGARFVSRWKFSDRGPSSTEVEHTIDVDFPGGPLSRLERWVLRRRLLMMQQRSLEQLATLLSEDSSP